MIPYAVTTIQVAATVSTLQSGSGDRLTPGDFVENLPTDPASLSTLVLLIGSLVLVVWANRGGGRKPD